MHFWWCTQLLTLNTAVEYKDSEEAKRLHRLARRKRKGLDDRHQQREGVVHVAGAFDTGDGDPGPSKRVKDIA